MRYADAITPLDPLHKTRLHEGIVEQIQNKILSGEFRAGFRLPPERDLAESLNVNRSTLREALKKLEMLELVEIRHGDGVYVKNYLESGNLELLRPLMTAAGSIDTDILKGLLQLRRLILPDVAFQAALNRNDEDLREMERVIGSDSGLSLNERDMALYRLIARASRNIPFLLVLNFFNNSGLVAQLLDLYFLEKANLSRTLRFYNEVVTAIRERNADASKKIMYGLLVYAERKTLDAIHKKSKDGKE
ncbi:MAG: FadR family transcriptional regulator [Spirochaetes bacterium]|nr:FadR family transcriptional regulator [Spirochaetota bacterium]